MPEPYYDRADESERKAQAKEVRKLHLRDLHGVPFGSKYKKPSALGAGPLVTWRTCPGYL